ncbi:hypothetical protein QBC47DRAFT_429173 [Echria macrotheca]|uniref:Allergen n=1 Tax=Echria macrotheca TaxID=438768 RepID=A0AAJ0FAN7_9PEZI|nr:hypothetical protein QBC47DRAFT_429173 [Echria macrotheca]
MDKTKKTINDIMSKSGHHDTTVHEHVAPAIEQKTIKPTSHEEVSTAVESEVHQDHYHRTVQPIATTEVLPEQHKHRVAGEVTREFDHRDQAATERAIKAEASVLRDDKTIEPTTHTQSRAPVVTGEHVHHHVHETVQPLLQKEVIQPEVIHTAVPVHEVHHNAARIHETTTKQPISIDEYKKTGGGLQGSSTTRTAQFEGCPSEQSQSTTSTSSITEGLKSATSTGISGSTTSSKGMGLGSSGHEEEKKKPGLLDRLNPYKDCR